MGIVAPPKPVKLVVGMISGRAEAFEAAAKRLETQFGPVDLRSDELPFDVTDYYDEEMGTGLRRRFLAYEELIDPGDLADIKLATNAIERELAEGHDGLKRVVNLDPGYVDLPKLVLATTKDHAHRLYLSKGIYAEVTLRYRKGTFQPLEWTYRDYGTKGYLRFFNEVRQRYRGQLREAMS